MIDGLNFLVFPWTLFILALVNNQLLEKPELIRSTFNKMSDFLELKKFLEFLFKSAFLLEIIRLVPWGRFLEATKLKHRSQNGEYDDTDQVQVKLPVRSTV